MNLINRQRAMINYSLFIKHFSNTANQNEKTEFDQWLRSSEDNRNYYSEMRKLWNEGRLLEHYQLFNKVVLYKYMQESK